MPKRTYQPKVKHRKRQHGFRARMSSKTGIKTIKRRLFRGRLRLTH